MLKRPYILCYGGRRLLIPSFPSPPPLPPSLSLQSHSSRSYATARYPDADLSWPSTTSFTPYDVFKQDRRAPYSKSRFYELAKIYHPDRPSNDHPSCQNISPEVRLQRYHLIVAAHEILSDPSKRAAYDFSGAGWSLHPRPPSPRSTPSYYAQRGTNGFDEAIYANATWEDWERWRNRNQPKQQNAVDNRVFTTLIVLMTFMGGALQMTWVNQSGNGYSDKVREINSESSELLTGRRENAIKQKASAEARVQDFLIRRDPSGSGLKEEEQSVYQDTLRRDTRGPPTDVEVVEDGGNSLRGDEKRDEHS